MKFFQHRAQFRRDALRQKNRDARADAQKFDVRNRAQPAQQIFQLVVAQQQRVAAAQQHVADFGMLRRCSRSACRIRDENRSRWRCSPAASACNNGNTPRSGPSPETTRGRDNDAPVRARANANLRRTGSLISHGAVWVSSMRGMTCRRIGQFSSAGSIRLKKYGVMASASLVFASFAPANSSGVSVGMKLLQLLRPW